MMSSYIVYTYITSGRTDLRPVRYIYTHTHTFLYSIYTFIYSLFIYLFIYITIKMQEIHIHVFGTVHSKGTVVVWLYKHFSS
jgi:hypothetical protein